MTLDPAEPAGLLDTARRIGHHVWFERRAFGWLGAWSGVALEPAVTAFLGEQSARHGWHAEVLYARLPELREVDAEALVVPGSPSVAEAVERALPAVDQGAALEALCGWYRVLLPVLVSSYRDLVAGASPTADRSLVRWLGFVLTDDLDEWSRGDALLRRLATTPEDVARLARRQQEVETCVVACGRFPG